MGVPMRLCPGLYFFQPVIRSQHYGVCRIVPVYAYAPVRVLLGEFGDSVFWVRAQGTGHLFCRVRPMQGAKATWLHGPDALALKDGRAPTCTPYLEPRP